MFQLHFKSHYAKRKSNQMKNHKYLRWTISNDMMRAE